MGIRAKITVPFLVVFSILYGGFVWISMVRVESAVENRLITRAEDMTRVVSGTPSILPQKRLLEKIAQAVGAKLVYYRARGGVVSSTLTGIQNEQVRALLEELTALPVQRRNRLREISLGSKTYFLVRFPLDLGGEAREHLVFFYPSANVVREKDEAVRSLIFPGIAGFFLFLILGVVLGHMVTSPIRELSEKAQSLVERDLEEVELAQDRGDEIGELSESLQNMVRRLQDKQEELVKTKTLAAIGQAAGRVAHEIRNPLSSIKMNLQMVQRTSETPPDPDMIEALLSETERLELILDEFLHMVEPGEGEKEKIQLHDLLEEVLYLVENRAEHRNIHLKQQTDSLPEIIGDEARLKQVFLNLILNSFEAMPEGGTIRIKTSVTGEGEQKMVQIDVLDTGPGIPEELTEKIFEPLYSSKSEELGLGLGLSISTEIVEDHGGTLRCLPSDQGAHFRIQLPVSPS